MELKILEENDLSKCIETFIKVFNDEPWNDEWTYTKAQKYLLDFYNTPGFLGILAIENKEVIGFIFGVHRTWWSGNQFYIHEMCVDSQRQNRGIGKSLLDYLIKSIGNNISNITLLTDRGIPAITKQSADSYYRIAPDCGITNAITRLWISNTPKCRFGSFILQLTQQVSLI